MEVKKDTVVEFTFSLVDDEGQSLESIPTNSTAILHGHGNVIRGVEKALEGKTSGEKFVVTVVPEEGYGAYRQDFTQRVSKKHFGKPKQLKTGQVAQLQTNQGTRPVTILKVGSKMVDVDLNHPHAGKTLNFDITITNVREATREELTHRHAHGAHGAHQ
jgi:FKBP-type peptidyl-prolyl cis-trans isomerase SlyD